MNQKPATTHKDLLEDLIDQIADKEVPFYRCSAQANYIGWHVLVVLTIMISAAAALIAALAPEDKLKEPLIRGFLIGLPLVGSALTTFLRTLNLHARERNREIGLIEAERLLRTARSLLASAATDEEYKSAFLTISDKLASLSHDQHALDVATRRGTQERGTSGDGDI
jgi:hypothetical protein